jgi:mannose-1-phosphate guanylyltransferase/mannose-6-phosphate isomerase
MNSSKTEGAVLVPVVLCGGAGTRLWPISRESSPKPFMQLPDGETLLQKCYRRALAAGEVASVITVTNRDYYFRCRDEFNKAAPDGQAEGCYLLEPFGRNTAAAIAMAAIVAAERFGPTATLLVLPSDHLIANLAAFRQDVEAAGQMAQQGWLTTFGIKPTHPETGFGYMERGDELTGGAFHALRFVEKPTLQVAKEYLASGRFYWNGGMFCFQAGAFLDALKEHAPNVHTAALAVWEKSRQGDTPQGVVELDKTSFAKVPDISVDYAVMEKSPKVALVPAGFDWSDIGSWKAIAELTPADENGNRVLGNAIVRDTHNCYVHSETRVVGALGLENCVIVDTPDALLVATGDQLQNVKVIVQELKARGHESATMPRTVVRPWGSYTTLEDGPRFKIKRLEVKPGAALSLQMHHHRAEHWVVVSGTARIVNGDNEFLLRTNESTYIPSGHKHRLENPGVIDLVLIEVQSGDYLGEDDIVRFEDRYGRAPAK